ncbi:hypothetical protein T12_6709 [Trichinella patagoniensis]|uniref:Uncharacterized protein n=1 Tax=Trichinella patagoniensis TaxID=990121 RepID=A0A0V1A085_9BILA|nr:hypothetical protein T12_6709 [Trichinella patagoniensis]
MSTSQIYILSIITVDYVIITEQIRSSYRWRSAFGEAPGYASGYAPGQIKICICPQATPGAVFCTIFGLKGPRLRLRLCPRANKNLHMPAGYAWGSFLHNICP